MPFVTSSDTAGSGMTPCAVFVPEQGDVAVQLSVGLSLHVGSITLEQTWGETSWGQNELNVMLKFS